MDRVREFTTQFITQPRRVLGSITGTHRDQYHGSYQQLPRVDLDRSSDRSDDSIFNRSRNDSIDAGCQADFGPHTIRQIQPGLHKFDRVVNRNAKAIGLTILVLLASVGWVNFPRSEPTVETVPEVFHEPIEPPDLTESRADCDKRIENMIDSIRADLNEAHKMYQAVKNDQLDAQVETSRRQLQASLEMVMKRQDELDENQKSAVTSQNAVNLRLEAEIDSVKKIELREQMARVEKTIESNKDRIQDDLHRIQSMLASHVAQSAELKNAIKMAQNWENRENARNGDSLQIDERIHQVVGEQIEKFAADKTGMADFALESAGAEVLASLTSAALGTGAAMVKIWNWPIFYQTMSPRLAIQPQVNPGNCYAFKGDNGQLAIKLSRKIEVRNVTIEHIPKSLSPIGNVESAPKDFEVYRINIDGSDAQLLDTFQYDIEKQTVQTFRLRAVDVAEAVMVKFQSNWGNSEHTCVYRVRVHGAPAE